MTTMTAPKLTAATNPVLRKYRSISRADRGLWARGFLAAAEVYRFPAWTDAEVEHAVRVLAPLYGR